MQQQQQHDEAESTRRKNDPNTYKHTAPEKFTINHDLEDIYAHWRDADMEDETTAAPQPQETTTSADQHEAFLLELVRERPVNETQLNAALSKVRRKLRINTKKSSLLRALNRMEASGDARLARADALRLRPVLVKKAGKSQSGVLVVTVLTSPRPKLASGKVQTFSCQWNCYYCPNEPGQPRSYLHDEPSVLRANRNEFDAVLQFFDRVATLAGNGHPADKVELLILGGTWNSYPPEYREEFIRDLFYAANVFAPTLEQARGNIQARARGSVEEEKRVNETTSGCKIIGITIETRPDCITPEALLELRKLGVTRVQIGLQHCDDQVLEKINRGHTVQHAKDALRLLKDACYKVDVHWMPNLPGASPEIDRAMFDQALGDPDLQADQWKIYPTEVTPWTVIEKWHREGTYVPYGEDELMNVLVEAKAKVHPWIRLNRVVRDIPSQYILGGVNSPSMRNSVQVEMARRGLKCRCIRCREVGDSYAQGGDGGGGGVAGDEGGGGFNSSGKRIPLTKRQRQQQQQQQQQTPPSPQNASSSEEDKVPHLVERRYTAQGGEEVFISIEAFVPARQRSDVLFGFCRLRFPSADAGSTSPFPELEGCALIRELHVYGQLAATPEALATGERSSNTQHVGHGTAMMLRAERLALMRGFRKLAVIAGVGSRGFYRKIGYQLAPGPGEMMIKELDGIGISSPRKEPRLMMRLPTPTVLTLTTCAAIVVLTMAVVCVKSMKRA